MMIYQGIIKRRQGSSITGSGWEGLGASGWEADGSQHSRSQIIIFRRRRGGKKLIIEQEARAVLRNRSFEHIPSAINLHSKR